MDTQLDLDGMAIDVVKKRIRNIHLRVYHTTGRVSISAPHRMSQDAIRTFVVSKIDWIKKQRHKISERIHEPPREFCDGETHELWGQGYQLRVVEKKAAPMVKLSPGEIILQVRPGSSTAARGAVIDAWYRRQLKEALPSLVTKWESLMGVKVKKLHVQKMKTRWGSCNTRTHHIRFNSELAKKPPEHLEYVVVHELVHLLEPSHNARFKSLMDHFLPNWRFYKDQLNQTSRKGRC